MGFPTSWQLQPPGQGDGDDGGLGGVVGEPRLTALYETLLEVPCIPEAEATPSMTAAGIGTAALVPGASVYVVPSLDVAAWNRSPTRWISTYSGGAVFACVTVVVVPPKAERYCTTSLLFGSRNTA